MKRSATTCAPRASAGATISSTAWARAAAYSSASARAPMGASGSSSTRVRTRSPTSRAAGFAQLDHLVPTLAQPGRVQARLGGLAGAVDALEADERGCCDPGTLPSAPAKEPAAAWRTRGSRAWICRLSPERHAQRPPRCPSGRRRRPRPRRRCRVRRPHAHRRSVERFPVSARDARHRFAVARQGCAHHAHDAQGGREASGAQAGPPR